ncbi:MAG: DNA helicase RecQ [Helicobacteraceae bacterium 4484_230]|nr:MAG: DNA helicase RecQ [Helicobacteraceae bacterium 4484_230]
MSSKYTVLKTVFGHDSFRPFQEDAVDTVLSGKDLLMILPTGGGKSLCYQLPSLLMDGVTIVISPLLALMHDQVMALKACGVAAEMIASTQSREENDAAVAALLGGELKMLYVAPERFGSDYFSRLLTQVRISFFVIDEAHCVSEWGHEFREDYRKLHQLRERFGDVGIAAFTATATPQVQEDITQQLCLRQPEVLRGKTFRENLMLNVWYRIKDGRAQLMKFLSAHERESGIVYAFTRKSTESIAVFLQSKGVKARAYHAGLSSDVRADVFHQFIHDEIDIVVATIAFGMGIDKSNIRFVVHINMPKTIENYYQEIGRAGRDGLASEVLLLYSTADMVQRKELILQLDSGEQYRNEALRKLGSMMRFATSEVCRHQSIASYFGDAIEACATQCDNCLNPHRDKTDITREAQMFLSAVYRSSQNFGQAYVIDILTGSKNQKILQNRHENLSVYGIGKERSRSEWFSIADRMLELEAVLRGDYQVLKLTKFGQEILRGKHSVEIREDRLRVEKLKSVKKRMVYDDVDMEIFDTLRSLRAEIARESGVPAYIVFGDKTLKEMAVLLPVSKEEMLDVNGVGEVKFKRYGERFLQLCKTLKQ